MSNPDPMNDPENTLPEDAVEDETLEARLQRAFDVEQYGDLPQEEIDLLKRKDDQENSRTEQFLEDQRL